MEENRIPKRELFTNLETTRLRGKPRSRWQDEMREDGRVVGGEGWQEQVHNKEEWKKLLRTARNLCILHMSMKWMNEYTCVKHVFEITDKQTKQTTKQPCRPKYQAISLRLLSVEARVLFHFTFFHCPGDGDCIYIGHIPQTLVIHLKNRKKVTKEWTNKVIPCSSFLSYEPIFAPVANNC